MDVKSIISQLPITLLVSTAIRRSGHVDKDTKMYEYTHRYVPGKSKPTPSTNDDYARFLL